MLGELGFVLGRLTSSSYPALPTPKMYLSVIRLLWLDTPNLPRADSSRYSQSPVLQCQKPAFPSLWPIFGSVSQ